MTNTTWTAAPSSKISGTYFRAYCAGFVFHANTIAEVQAWLDGKRKALAGETLTIHKFTDNVCKGAPILQGPVSA